MFSRFSKKAQPRLNTAHTGAPLSREAAQAAVALLAGQQPPEAADPRMASFPAAIRRTGGWRLRLAEQGLADLAAMMEPGLAALLSVQAHGGDARPPARALLQEFAAARAALLALVR